MKREMEEKGETPEMETEAHQPKFLKKAAKLAGRRKGEKKVEVKKAERKR